MACDSNTLLVAGAAFQALSYRDLRIATCSLLAQNSGTPQDASAILAAGKAFQALSDYHLKIATDQIICNVIGP